jgi:hypothetical protein
VVTAREPRRRASDLATIPDANQGAGISTPIIYIYKIIYIYIFIIFIYTVRLTMAIMVDY